MSHWKGGRIKKKAYYYILRPSHPLSRYGGYIREHLIVYEDANRCCVLPWANIHHKNGIKDDNRPENLELIGHANHTILHNTRYDGLSQTRIANTRHLWKWLFPDEHYKMNVSRRGISWYSERPDFKGIGF